MTEADAYSALTNIFGDVFLRDDVVLRPDTTAADIEGWDSFKQVEIIMAVEEQFAIKFSTREIDSLTSVGVLAALLCSKAS